MLQKSFGGICHAFIHAAALGCAGLSVYFLFATSIEQVASAVVLLGAAIVLEVIVAVVGDDTTAHT
jgi:HD-like signal output (HDOD) protein